MAIPAMTPNIRKPIPVDLLRAVSLARARTLTRAIMRRPISPCGTKAPIMALIATGTRASVGGSTTVDADRWTVVDIPTRHAGEAVAERPPSTQIDERWPICRHATPAKRWQSGHRRRKSMDGGRYADTPRRRSGGRAATVLRFPGRIDHGLRRAA